MATGDFEKIASGQDFDLLVFDFVIDSDVVLSKHEQGLREAIKFVDSSPDPVVVSIDGFASRTGTAAHNKALSERRERAVERFLIANSKTIGPGRTNRVNPDFHGFSDSPPGENPRFRSVRVVVHRPGVVPPPIPVPVPPVPVPPVPPTTTAFGSFRLDLIGWIPQPEVDNPLAELPAFVKSLLPSGMADPFFGGDNFTTPGATPSSILPPVHTFRATQSLQFNVGSWGDIPTISINTATPGTTTCLSARRAAGGVVTFSLTAKLLRASGTVTFSSLFDLYEVNMSGKVLDPVPAAAAAALTAKLPGVPAPLRPALASAIQAIATKATPALSWDITLRVQRGTTLNPVFVANYAPFIGAEASGTISGAVSSFAGGTFGLEHGDITFSLWPSAVLYLTVAPTGKPAVTQPVFFSDGSGATPPVTLKILVPKLCKFRQLTF